MAGIDSEIRMTIKVLAEKGCSKAEVSRLLGIPESNVRYHLKRIAAGAIDRRGLRPRKACLMAEAIGHWMGTHEHAGVNLAELHAWLVVEHDYAGSLRSVERYVRDVFPAPATRARRRVETPPGAQAQADWAIFPRMNVGGELLELSAFHMVLAHSRYEAIVWSPRRTQLSWLGCHNGGFERLGGIPAVVRVDNDTAAVAHGAGAWGTLTQAYRRYAMTVRFHVDLCPPREPRAKGKVERRVRAQRFGIDPTHEAWRDLAELQAWTDEAMGRDARRRRCPATGTSVMGSWEAERRLLAPLPRLPEPFDAVATRPVAHDSLVSFEGRQYSVPFALVGSRVEVRGCAGRVQIMHQHTIVASHERHTVHRLVIDPSHYDGPSTAAVIAPPPLGRMGRRLEEIARMPVAHRPVDLYAALAEVAR
jgi:transposase